MGQIKQVGEFKQIQEILSNIGTDFLKIDEEMTEKSELHFFKKPLAHEMRQTAIHPIFSCC